VTLLNAAVTLSYNEVIDALELREDIRLSAFHKWDAAGKPTGDGAQFWLEAEQELKAGQELAVGRNEKLIGRDDRRVDGALQTQAAGENAKALNSSVDSHYRDNNRMFQRHGERGHRHGGKSE
jgi:hypothetical protein